MGSFYSRSIRQLCFLCLGVGAALAFPTAHAGEASQRQEKLNGGYYLLHHVASDESQLPLLLLIKHAPPEVKDYADRISRTGKETVAVIERLQRGDASIQFDKNPLPAIEQDTRDSIKADKQHQLLFGTKDAEFVRALLVSQIEASTYALNLAKVLAEQEKDPDRVTTLHHLSAQWLEMRNQAFRLLRNY
jgi:hypothetical protein